MKPASASTPASPMLPLVRKVVVAGLVLGLGAAATSPGWAWSTLPARTNDTPGFVHFPSAADWRDINIYHVMTDRFFNGDTGNDAANPRGTVDYADPDKIHGGDFLGVQQKLDYLQMLGVKAILLAPVLHNTWGAYQGYGTGDFNQIDPHWGGLADLRALIDAAHARGMYVFLDMVVNHAADLIDSADPGYPAFRLTPEYTPRWKPEVGSVRHVAPFDTFDKFYMHGTMENWDDPIQAELGDYPGLDSIRTTLPQVRQDFITIYRALIAATDCDGFRADTAKHVELGFWDVFLPAIASATSGFGKSNFLIFAEATKGTEPELGVYTQSNRFNSAINFPLRGTFDAVFIENSDTGRLTHHFRDAQLTNYSARARYQLVNFVDNHDVARYAARLNSHLDRLKLALTYLHTTLHIPYVYYGTEQAFDGAGDPDNREDMFDGLWEFGPSLGDNFDYTHPLFIHIRKLNLLRDALPPLRRGGYLERWSTYQATGGAGLYVFSRTNGTDEVVIALNTTNATRSAANIPVGYPAGTLLRNVEDPADILTVTTGSNIAVTLAGYTAKIYHPNLLNLPPTILAQAPGHSSNNIPTTATLSLSFDKPVNKPLIETNFALDPLVPGTFAWFDGDRRFVFTPARPLGANTRHTITLAAPAGLGAAFRSFFDTTGYATLGVAGSFNGWNPAANNMTLVAPHLWRYDTTFTNATAVQFKFTANGSWDLNWGETNQTKSTPPLTGTAEFFAPNNITVAGTLHGPYRFEFNDQTFAYSLAVLDPPTVLAVAPTNSQFNVPLTTPITVTFSKPMNRPATESAFALAPPVTGTFTWLDGDTRLVFTPTAPLTMHTTYTLTLGVGALATNGQGLTAPHQTTFDTASGYTTLSVAGTFNGFNPAANNMTVVGKNLWQWDTTFLNTPTIAFKFAANGNWNINWGDNNPTGTTIPLIGTGEHFGADIQATGPLHGTYRFLLNDQTGAFALVVPGTDSDGDGATDMDEFLTGTNPLNAADALRITNITAQAGHITIQFTTAPGRRYILDTQPHPAAPWVPLLGPAATNQFTHPGATVETNRLYRIRLAP